MGCPIIIDMKRIGIIVAMDKEQDLIIQDINPTYSISGKLHKILIGAIGSAEVGILKSGIGKVNAAIATVKLIECFHPDLIINTGVAGGLIEDGPLNIGDVFMPSEVAYHDAWCGPGTIYGAADGCTNPLPCVTKNVADIHIGGRLASGDKFITGNGEIMKVAYHQPTAIAVDMESGAIAQTCYLFEVPFMCIRLISDVSGAASNAEAYNEFWRTAAIKSFATLRDIVHKVAND